MGRIIIAVWICTMALSACGQNPVVNRWLVAGQLKNGKLSPVNKKSREYEFLKGNNFNIYENGTIKENGTYSLAGDKKSMLLKIDDESIPLKIIKLSATEFDFVVDIGSRKNDTLVCYSSNSPIAKSMVSKKNAEGWSNIENAWNNIKTEYQRRSDIAANLVAILKGSENFDEKTIEELVAARKKITGVNIKPEDLTAKSVQEYQLAQTEMGNAIKNAFVKVEEKTELKHSESIRQMQLQMEGIENSINIARSDYNHKVAVYNSAAEINKLMQKDIAFKPDAGSEKPLQVKF